MTRRLMKYDIEESQAFVETVIMAPKSSGVLTGLRFAVKDLIDLGGYKTSCGNPTWRDTHPVAARRGLRRARLLAF